MVTSTADGRNDSEEVHAITDAILGRFEMTPARSALAGACAEVGPESQAIGLADV